MLRRPAGLRACGFVGLVAFAVLAGATLSFNLAGTPFFNLAGATPAGAQELPTPDVVTKVTPSVVNVFAERVVRSRAPSLFNDPFFRRFFGDAPEGRFGRERTQKALGSGVIVDARGIVVTNHHVVKNAEELRVVLSDNREFAADLVLGDERTDLAVLRIRSEDARPRFPALSYRNSDNVRVGDTVLAIGNPFGVGQTVTSGIVSALARAQIGITDYQSFIQTDAAINPGNSGGALVTMDGKLLGINTAIFTRSGGSVGIGFAIPSNLVRQVVRTALQEGKVVLPWLGADLQRVSAELAQTLGMARPTGALVAALHPDSPLLRAGVEVGDVVLQFDRHPIASPENLRYRFATAQIGTIAQLRWYHQGERRRARVVVMAPPETPARRETKLKGRHALSGLTIANLNPALQEELRIGVTQSGVVALAVSNNSPAARFGFRSGDRVLSLNGRAIANVAGVQELIAAGSINAVEIQRGAQRLRARLRQ